jgi:hypothetical protein
MKLRHTAPVALVVALALASVAAAGPNPCCVAGNPAEQEPEPPAP